MHNLPYMLSALITLTSAAPGLPPSHLHRRQDASPIKCPIILDGRVSTNTTLATFDTAQSKFSPDFVKGANLTFSNILNLPTNVTTSRFDAGGFTAVGVTINDQSIFAPGGKPQNGFRRVGLQFAGDPGDGTADASDSGVVTSHWSVMQDVARPLNFSHEYLNVFHEAADFSSDQIMFQTGQLLSGNGTGLAPETFKVAGREGGVVFSTPVQQGMWQNFAVMQDVNASTFQVFFSNGNAPLEAVTGALPNNNTGAGQFQMGILKKPTGTDDVVNSGFQESGINEGQIYGGLFVEKSAGGCISL